MRDEPKYRTKEYEIDIFYINKLVKILKYNYYEFWKRNIILLFSQYKNTVSYSHVFINCLLPIRETVFSGSVLHVDRFFEI